MDIRFGEHRIFTNHYCYTLARFNGYELDKNGAQRERWKNLGYFRKLSDVASALPDHAMRATHGNLEKALSEVKAVEERLTEALRKLEEQ